MDTEADSLVRQAWILPRSILWRIAYILCAVVGPWVVFVVVAGDSYVRGEPWQSGRLEHYFSLLFDSRAALFLVPLFVVSTIITLVVIINQDRFLRFALVRVGLYVHTAFLCQFIVFYLLSAGRVYLFITYLFALAIALVIAATYGWWRAAKDHVVLKWMGVFTTPLASLIFFHPGRAIPWVAALVVFSAVVYLLPGFMKGWPRRRFTGLSVLFSLSLASLLAFAYLVFAGDAFLGSTAFDFPAVAFSFMLPFVSGALGGPAMLFAAFRLAKHGARFREESKGAPVVLAVSTGAAYAATWTLVIRRAIELYETLPTTPPSCFVATAAARGHRSFVSSFPIAAGSSTPVTGQLQVLKAGEIALKLRFPRLHAWLRRLYNRVGPTLARRIDGPGKADIAYLLLKPAEIVTRFLFRSLLPRLVGSWKGLYRR